MGPAYRFVQHCADVAGEVYTESELARHAAYTVTSWSSGFGTVVWMLFYYFYDHYFLDGESLVVIRNLTALAFVFALLPFFLRYGVVVATVVGLVTSVPLILLWTSVLGADSGLHLFLFIVIVNGLTILGAKYVILASVGTLVVLGAALFAELAFDQPSNWVRVDETLLNTVWVISATNTVLQLATTIRVLMDQLARTEEALAAEHARSEALLQNLLPDDIASRLKNNPGEIIADGLPAVTLLFADIVDFTPRAARLSPEEVVGFLNRIFSAFDRLAAERGLEKIKTIGDAYMVAAGLPNPRPDHAEIMADMALAMRAAVAGLSQEIGEDIQLRIGLHSGPAIAGVIGTSKVFYDVWGDTVNTASRMESYGASGRIQVTSATRAQLKASYTFTRRGVQDIKGLGQIETHWLDGPLNA
ncbi:MAG: adenylate/guanylate cyclase domain-containing protein [Pseudomonadota bacterium]